MRMRVYVCMYRIRLCHHLFADEMETRPNEYYGKNEDVEEEEKRKEDDDNRNVCVCVCVPKKRDN